MWNWRPTPNIRRMTPTSANWSATCLVGDEPRRIGSDQESRQQVANDGGQAQAERRIAANQGGRQRRQ